MASGTPWDASATVSFSGQFVAAMRRRRSSKASSGTSTWKGRMSLAVSTVLLMTTSLLAQGPEGGSHLVGEEVRLLPGGEVVALVDFVEVDEVGVGLLGPAPRGLVELVGEDAHRGRNRDALDVEEAEGVLPVETTRGHAGVGHPGERDVVQDLVSGEVADRLAGEGGGDVVVAAGVVVQHPGGQGDG